MVDVAVTATTLSYNTKSGDLVGSGTAITTGQTVSLAVANDSFRYMLVMEETGSTTASVVFDAGSTPPSMRGGLGTLTVTFAANDLRVMMFEGGRFIQDGTTAANVGKITCTVTGTMKFTLLLLPLHDLA